MSKRDLRKYVSELSKEQLEEQILELYEKFSPVKVYYNFVFAPNEDKLLQEAKLKISHEYFPIQNTARKKKPKLRRSVAQKYIKHFKVLGVDSFIIAELMLYSIELAQVFSAENTISQTLFYKSMENSFKEVVLFTVEKMIFDHFKHRIITIKNETFLQKWTNKTEFNAIIDPFLS